MDWNKLSKEEVLEFLRFNGYTEEENYLQVANQLIGATGVRVTEPVYDLYVSQSISPLSPAYELRDLETLSPKARTKFSKLFNLDPHDPHLLSRIIHIISLAGKLITLSNLPSDIYYHIGFNLNYYELQTLCTVSKSFATLCTNPLFWKLKTMRDFSLTEDEFDRTNRENMELLSTPSHITFIGYEGIDIPGATYSDPVWKLEDDQTKVPLEHETYIMFAGYRGIAIPGAIKYGNINTLALSAATQLVTSEEDESRYWYLTRQYFSIRRNNDIFTIFGHHNRADLIGKAIRLVSDLSIPQYLSKDDYIINEIVSKAVMGAAEYGHNRFIVTMIQMMNSLIFLKVITKRHPFGEAALLATKKGHLSTLKLFKYDLGKRIRLLYKVIYKASKYDRSDFLDYLFSIIPLYNAAMAGAAAGGHQKRIDTMIEKGAINFNQGLAAAARYGHRDIVNFMIAKGAQKFSKGLIAAAKGGYLDIVLDMINLGARNFNQGLKEAARHQHLPIVQEMVNRGATDLSLALNSAAEKGNLPIVSWLIDRVPQGLGKAISYACINKQIDMINFLFDYHDYHKDIFLNKNELLNNATISGEVKILQLVMGKFGSSITDDDILNLMWNATNPENPNMLYYLQLRYPQLFQKYLQEQREMI